MIRWALRALAFVFDLCPHNDMIRERRGLTLYFVCPLCGYAEPIIKRVK